MQLSDFPPHSYLGSFRFEAICCHSWVSLFHLQEFVRKLILVPGYLFTSPMVFQVNEQFFFLLRTTLHGRPPSFLHLIKKIKKRLKKKKTTLHERLLDQDLYPEVFQVTLVLWSIRQKELNLSPRWKPTFSPRWSDTFFWLEGMSAKMLRDNPLPPGFGQQCTLRGFITIIHKN